MARTPGGRAALHTAAALAAATAALGAAAPARAAATALPRAAAHTAVHVPGFAPQAWTAAAAGTRFIHPADSGMLGGVLEGAVGAVDGLLCGAGHLLHALL